MNTQLVDSIVQMVETLSLEEREFVKQKLSILPDFRSERLRLSTVQKWEVGQKRPTDTALKLLHLVQEGGIDRVL